MLYCRAAHRLRPKGNPCLRRTQQPLNDWERKWRWGVGERRVYRHAGCNGSTNYENAPPLFVVYLATCFMPLNQSLPDLSHPPHHSHPDIPSPFSLPLSPLYLYIGHHLGQPHILTTGGSGKKKPSLSSGSRSKEKRASVLRGGKQDTTDREDRWNITTRDTGEEGMPDVDG